MQSVHPTLYDIHHSCQVISKSCQLNMYWINYQKKQCIYFTKIHCCCWIIILLFWNIFFTIKITWINAVKKKKTFNIAQVNEVFIDYCWYTGYVCTLCSAHPTLVIDIHHQIVRISTWCQLQRWFLFLLQISVSFLMTNFTSASFPFRYRPFVPHIPFDFYVVSKKKHSVSPLS